MDPATIIGTTSAVLGIVQVVTKSISSLRDLHERFKLIRLEISSLIAQLNSLKAALNKISEWMESDLAQAPQHHQLVMDIEEAISSCHVLVLVMDGHIDGLKRKDDGSPTLLSEIQVVFRTTAFKDVQIFLDRQTIALNLLLTACNWYTSLSFI